MTEQLVLAILLLGVTLYAVLGGADFGAGIWDLTAGSASRGAAMRGVIARAMGPVWEANHVWLVFVMVVCWTAFPSFFGSMVSSLWIPMSIAALGIILRGSAFALRTQSATLAEARALGGLFALSSVIVPFALGSVAGAIASGQVAYGNAVVDPWGAFVNPFSIYVGVVAVVFCAYLAAVFLVGDARRMGAQEIADAFRRRALVSGTLAGALALGGLALARSEATYLYDGLTSGLGLVFMLGSLLAGGATLLMVWRGTPEWPRYSAAAAVGAVVAGWGVAQWPYLLPPGASGSSLTVADGAGASATLGWLIAAVFFALAIIAPSLYLLYRLTLDGTLEPDYKFEQLTKSSSEPEETE